MRKRGYYNRNLVERYFIAYGESGDYLVNYYEGKEGPFKGSIRLLDYFIDDSTVDKDPSMLVLRCKKKPSKKQTVDTIHAAEFASHPTSPESDTRKWVLVCETSEERYLYVCSA